VPTTREHLHRAKQNLAFAESFNLNTTQYLDWVVAAYFYAALHLVDALLCEMDDEHPPVHELRRDLVKEKWYLRAIKDEYRGLKDYSEDARYRLITMTRVKIEQKIIPLYKAIERHIMSQLEQK
jgi:HEPN domain-containing protein